MHNHSQRGAGLLPAIGLLALILILVGGAYYYMRDTDAPGSNATTTPQQGTQMSTYTSARYGVTFQYPDSYVLTESDQPGSAMREHHTIVLMDREAAANIPVGGEGPPTINIDLFQNNLDNQTAAQWIQNTNVSNYKLPPDIDYSTTTVAGVEAYTYPWEGLYNGESYVFVHGDYIVMASVSYFSPADEIRADFEAVLDSLTLN